MGIMESMAFSTSFLRHFMAIEVSATGRKPFMQVVCGFLGEVGQQPEPVRC